MYFFFNKNGIGQKQGKEKENENIWADLSALVFLNMSFLN